MQIISASRRTDLPAFYGEWFMNRVHAGWCAVPNPFNPKQVSRIELDPLDTLLVFWTRWPAPFMQAAAELRSLGFRYYVHYTVLDYPPAIHAKAPGLEQTIGAFLNLAEMIGPERMVWRYDPILFSANTDGEYHLSRFAQIARRLQGATKRVVISILEPYQKAARRLARLAQTQPAYRYLEYDAARDADLLRHLVRIAHEHGLKIHSCAEQHDLASVGIAPGKCIDDQLIQSVFGVQVSHKKDKSQRDACGCVESRDIGIYDSCAFGCAYCYANRNFDSSARHHAMHDRQSESLIGHYRAPPRRFKPEQSKTPPFPADSG